MKVLLWLFLLFTIFWGTANGEESASLLNFRRQFQQTTQPEKHEKPMLSHKKSFPMFLTLEEMIGYYDFFISLMNPKNLQTIFFRLIRESSLKNKSNAMRIFTTLLNYKSRDFPRRFVDSMNSFDDKGFDELVQIILKYMKAVLKNLTGDKYEIIMEYFDEENIKELAHLIFTVEKETNREDVIWLVGKLRNRSLEDFNWIFHLLNQEESESVDDTTLRKMVRGSIEDTKKFATFDKFLKRTPEFVRIFQNFAQHNIEVSLDFSRDDDDDFDSAILLNSTLAFFDKWDKNIQLMMNLAREENLFDGLLDELETLKEMDETTARQEIRKLENELHTVIDLFDAFGDKSERNIGITNIFKFIEATDLSDRFLDKGIDGFLFFARLLNTDLFRNLSSLVMKNRPNEINYFKVLYNVTFTMIRDGVIKFLKLDQPMKSIDELEENLINAVDSIDGEELERKLLHISLQTSNINTDGLVEAVVELNHLKNQGASLFDVIFNENHKTISKSLKKQTIEEIILLLDSVNLLNSTHLQTHCNDYGQLNNPQETFRNQTNFIKESFGKVENGEEFLKMIHFQLISQFFLNLMKTYDLKTLCNSMFSPMDSSGRDNSTSKAVWDLLALLKNILPEADETDEVDVPREANNYENVILTLDTVLAKKYEKRKSNVLEEYIHTEATRIKEELRGNEKIKK